MVLGCVFPEIQMPGFCREACLLSSLESNRIHFPIGIASVFPPLYPLQRHNDSFYEPSI